MKTSDNDKMRSEYDFSKGARGKHAESYVRGTNVVFLEPDIAAIFKDSNAVNKALRLLVDLAGSTVRANEIDNKD